MSPIRDQSRQMDITIERPGRYYKTRHGWYQNPRPPIRFINKFLRLLQVSCCSFVCKPMQFAVCRFYYLRWV